MRRRQSAKKSGGKEVWGLVWRGEAGNDKISRGRVGRTVMR